MLDVNTLKIDHYGPIEKSLNIIKITHILS